MKSTYIFCYPRVLEMFLGVCASPSCCDHSGAHMGILDASPGYCITWDFCIPPKKNKDCHTDTGYQTFPYMYKNLSIFRSPQSFSCFKVLMISISKLYIPTGQPGRVLLFNSLISCSTYIFGGIVVHFQV